MTTEPADEDLTPGDFWRALGMRATGVTIITTKGAKGPAGFMALSATHLSAAPPLMTISVSASTSALPVLLESGAFAINYLSEGGREIHDRFTARDAPRGSARFEGLAWSELKTGAPVFDAVTGALDCRVEEVIERHGTSLVIGRIVGKMTRPEARPLVHFAGGLTRLAD
ncbi:flavin reductase [Rhodobacteraceae bacterium NNCM2]|nr:flavin reductase [Coraliihabitans acroporae]